MADNIKKTFGLGDRDSELAPRGESFIDKAKDFLTGNTETARSENPLETSGSSLGDKTNYQDQPNVLTKLFRD